MKTILAIAFAFATGASAAQGPGKTGQPSGTQAASGTGVQDQAPTMRHSTPVASDPSAEQKDRDAKEARLENLKTQERAEIDAVAADKTKSVKDRKAAIRKIRERYRVKERGVRDQLKVYRAEDGAAKTQ